MPSMATLSCDYLVVGGGASGLAFVDELIHRSKDLTVVLVDRWGKIDLSFEQARQARRALGGRL